MPGSKCLVIAKEPQPAVVDMSGIHSKEAQVSKPFSSPFDKQKSFSCWRTTLPWLADWYRTACVMSLCKGGAKEDGFEPQFFCFASTLKLLTGLPHPFGLQQATFPSPLVCSTGGVLLRWTSITASLWCRGFSASQWQLLWGKLLWPLGRVADLFQVAPVVPVFIPFWLDRNPSAQKKSPLETSACERQPGLSNAWSYPWLWWI